MAEEKEKAGVVFSGPAFIDEGYMPLVQDRLSFYQKISKVFAVDDLFEIKEEFLDRFGVFGKNIENLFLITEIQYLKTTSHRNFAIVDAAMNDMLRPALYDAWLEILPISKRHGIDSKTWDIVGPVCESGDFLGHQRNLAIEERDILAVLSAGAYGSSMSSNYNSRCRAAEVIVDSETIHLARKRESFNDLILGENLLAKTEKP